jgi:type VI secretion system secreted protein VgrG
LIRGSGNCRYMTAGHQFMLDRLDSADGPYMITSIRHSARLGGEYRSVASPEETAYSNSFTCIPAAVPFRPRRVTPKPIVHGTQTAEVVGPSGEEIFCDKYGRVKVQFRWDRKGRRDADSSCWVRVGNVWAGNRWGGITIPRIGQDVIVAFEEGDPDRPIIVGSVYNAETMPPYDLPRNKTQSGLKSRSTTQGSPDNFNELRFEDKKGDEQVYFHAEKNFDRVVENNDTTKIGFTKKDPGDQILEVYNNQTLKVGTPQSSEGSQSTTIYKDRTTELQTGTDSLKIDQGDRDAVISLGNDTLSIKMGNQTTKLDLGAISTEAMQSIELKVGQSSIKIDQKGVTISGMLISIDGQVQTSVSGLVTEVSGKGLLRCNGGLVLVN